MNSIGMPSEKHSVKQETASSESENLRRPSPEVVSPAPIIRPQKVRKRRNIGSESEGEEFEANLEVNAQKVTYKKKNTESNIVNQTFSYLNSQKSRREVLRLLNNSEKVKEFYHLMEKVKKGSKKYINRKYIKQLLAF